MKVRMFEVGSLCVHEGMICRVDEVKRKFASRLGYMGVKDGTEFNPTLTLTPTHDSDGVAVINPRKFQVSAGSVESTDEAVLKLESQVERLEKRLSLLRQGIKQ